MAGRARGRRLRVPASGTRPTSDRAREAVFSSLESLRGGFTDTVVLDLYAGSGALGLEALSRGASHVDLVESDREAAQVIKANAATVLATDAGGSSSWVAHCEVHAVSVERWLAPARRGNDTAAVRYDVVFCDPPYATPAEEVIEGLVTLLAGGRLADDALVVVERASRDLEWSWPSGLVAIKDRGYGEAHLWIGGAEVGAAPAAGAGPSDSVAPC